MKLFRLRILAPEQALFDGMVQRLVVRTTEGDLGILPEHEKYVAALTAGSVRIVMNDGTVRMAALSGGMVKVSAGQTVILANAAEWA